MQFSHFQLPLLAMSISAFLFGVIFPVLPGFRISKHKLSLALGFGVLSSMVTVIAFFFGGFGVMLSGWAGFGGAGAGVTSLLLCGSIVAAIVFNIIGIMMLIRYLQKQFPALIEVQNSSALFLAALLVSIANGVMVALFYRRF